MALFGGLFGASKRNTQDAVATRLRQERPTVLVPDFPAPWASQLPGVVANVDVASLHSWYRELDETGRLFLLEDLAEQFDDDDDDDDDTELYDAWSHRLAGSSDPIGQLLLATVHLGAGWHDDGLAGAMEAGRAMGTEIAPYLIAQECAIALPAGEQVKVAQHWQAIDPFHPRGLEILGHQFDERHFGNKNSQLALAEQVARTAPAGHPGLGAVPALVMQRWDYLAVEEDRYFNDCDERTVELARVQAFLSLAYRKLHAVGKQDPRVEAAVLNRFLWCFHFGMENGRAHDVLGLLRGRASASVWTFRDEDDNPVTEFEDARDSIIREVEFDLDDEGEEG
ncbi:MAG: hypothetical protein Q4G35_02000 [Propionibacteriaceae bacterium]|nr:hypothetical protein [Propionibacteriaceae bacterium]